MELMAEHGSYAGSCSLWKPFGAYLIAEKGTLLSTVCLFVYLCDCGDIELELLFIGRGVFAVKLFSKKDKVPIIRDCHHELLPSVGPFIWNTVSSRGNFAMYSVSWSRYFRYGLQNQNVEGNCNGKQ